MIQKFISFTLIAGFLFSCKKEIPKETLTKEIAKIATVKSLNYQQLKPLLEKQDNKIYVVNFWATWCAPCVKELPYFEKIGAEYKNKNVEVLLVSLDFPKQVSTKLIPFINDHKLTSEVVLLDDFNEDIWIKAIDATWSGALPATLIYHKNKRKFYEQTFDYETLENELKQFLN